MKEKVNQMLKDKLFLVMLVLGLLTMVAAAGIMTVQKGKNSANDPMLHMAEEENTPTEEALQMAGASDAREKTQEEDREETVGADAGENPNEGNDLLAEAKEQDGAAEAGAGKEAAHALALNFTESSSMVWPVRGNVLLDYSMDQTIYFPTLDQYKCNPGIVIQSDVSAPVTEVGVSDEIGNYVVLDLGNEYTAVCGQLKEISAAEGEYLEAGQTLGYVAEPTKYYSVEGVNVFFELKHKGETVDPLNHME
mgnify:CR=1 FL=1